MKKIALIFSLLLFGGCVDEENEEDYHCKLKVEAIHNTVSDNYKDDSGEACYSTGDVYQSNILLGKNGQKYIVDLSRRDGTYGRVYFGINYSESKSGAQWRSDVLDDVTELQEYEPYYDDQKIIYDSDFKMDEQGKSHFIYAFSDRLLLRDEKSLSNPSKSQLVYLTNFTGKWAKQYIEFDQDPIPLPKSSEDECGPPSCRPFIWSMFRPTILPDNNGIIHVLYGKLLYYGCVKEGWVTGGDKVKIRYSINHAWKALNNFDGKWQLEEVMATEDIVDKSGKGTNGEMFLTPYPSEAAIDSKRNIHFVYCLLPRHPYKEINNLMYVTNKSGDWKTKSLDLGSCGVPLNSMQEKENFVLSSFPYWHKGYSPSLLIDKQDQIHVAYLYDYQSNYDSFGPVALRYAILGDHSPKYEVVLEDIYGPIELFTVGNKISIGYFIESNFDDNNFSYLTKEDNLWKNHQFNFIIAGSSSYVGDDKGNLHLAFTNDASGEAIRNCQGENLGDVPVLSYIILSPSNYNETEYCYNDFDFSNCDYCTMPSFNYNSQDLEVFAFPMCLTNKGCDDGSDCTEDVCSDVGEDMPEYVCVRERNDKCFFDLSEKCDIKEGSVKTCFNDVDCADNDVCTKDKCKEEKCVNKKNNDCCFDDNDCDDDNICTIDSCKKNSCSHKKEKADCCEEDSECGDDNPDTISKCIDGICLITCFKKCAGKECGDDDCGGSCGECLSGYECDEFVCVPSE